MTRIRALSLVTLLCAVANAGAQQPRDNQQLQSVGTGSITGIVVDDKEGRPLRRGRVMLSGSDLESARTTVTADDGTFLFERLPAGRYSVGAEKGGYVSMRFGATRPGRPGTTFLLRHGESRRVTLRLPHGSVITGRLLNPEQEPAANVTVMALASTFDRRRGERRVSVVPGSTVTTDDRGVYRIFGLAAGTYFVSALPRLLQGTPGNVEVLSQADIRRALEEVRATTFAARPGMPAPSPAPAEPPERKTVGLTPIFYPGTPLEARAVPITLGTGEVRHDADFDIEHVPTAAVEGSVTVPPGMYAQVVIADADRKSTAQTTRVVVRPGEDGRFTFGPLPPGTFAIAARAFPMRVRAGASPSEGSLYGETTITVSGEDISGIPLTLQPALSISGRILFESTDGTSPMFPGPLRIPLQASSVSTSLSAALPPVLVSDGRFSIAGVMPGTYRFSAEPRGLRAPIGRWWLKSVLMNGREMLDSELDLRQSTDEPVIVFSDRASELSGVVREADGSPAADSYLVVFAAPRSAWFHGSRRVAGVRLPATGRYSLRNLPAGDYYVAVTADVEPDEWFDPEILQRLATGASLLSMADGESRTLDLLAGR